MFRRAAARLGGSRPTTPAPEETPSVIDILDKGCADYSFPMLDNGYVYLAATRLSLFRSALDWVMTFEVFGYSVRAGLPDTFAWSFGSNLANHERPEDAVGNPLRQRYLTAHRFDEATSFFPIEPGDWQDPDDVDNVSRTASTLVVRGDTVALPDRATYIEHGIVLSDPDRVRVFELCRYLADTRRDQVLLAPDERRVHVRPELDELLVLDDWHHPDLVVGQRASQTRSFTSLARVLETGDATLYDASEPPNTHWRNWPDGGTL